MCSMILSESEDSSQVTLTKLEPLQRGDFEEIFRTMDSLPVTVGHSTYRCTSSSPAPASWPRGWSPSGARTVDPETRRNSGGSYG
jgi:hypothetical protein